MCHGYDPDLFRQLQVNHSEWKTMDEVGARATTPDRPSARGCPDHIHCRENFLAKILAESFDTLFVKILRRKELRLSCGVEDKRFHVRRRGRRANTLRAGIPRARPSRISRTRRVISASHCCSASGSLSISRLWINTCANRARCPAAIRNARSVTDSAVFIFLS